MTHKSIRVAYIVYFKLSNPPLLFLEELCFSNGKINDVHFLKLFIGEFRYMLQYIESLSKVVLICMQILKMQGNILIFYIVCINELEDLKKGFHRTLTTFQLWLSFVK